MSPADPTPPRKGPRRSAGEAARARDAFDAVAANLEMAEKLRRNKLRRLARARGLDLRYSDHGYSLIDGARKRIDGRNDLTLDEVEARLAETAG